MKKLWVDLEKCTGCRRCELACSWAHEGNFAPSLSRIRVIRFERVGIDGPVFCRQCSNTPCVAVCPFKALRVDEATGAVIVDGEKCVGCGLCVDACVIGAVTLHPQSHVALICDLCGGNPVCVRECEEKALQYTKSRPAVQNKRERVVKAMAEAMLRSWNIKG